MNAPVVFMSGDPVGTTACENLTVIDDDTVEAEQTFTVSASSTNLVVFTPTSEAVASIIPIANDIIDESSEEFLTVITSSTNPVVISPTSEAVVSIADNDCKLKHWKLEGSGGWRVISALYVCCTWGGMHSGIIVSHSER